MTDSCPKNQYLRFNRRNLIFILFFIVLAAASFFLTLGFGTYNISVGDAIGCFIDHLSGNVKDSTGDHYIWDVRLPRAIAALACGVALSVAGAVMQNDFRNPLAEPYTMGIASGAFLGAVLSIILGISIVPFLTNQYSIIANAAIFSLIPTFIIVLVAKIRKTTPSGMILTGIAVMFLFSSISQIIMVTSPSESMAEAYAWRVGDLGTVGWADLPYMVVSTFVITAIIMLLAGKMNVMYAGDDYAKTMGENAENLRIVTLVLVSVMTAAVVSFTGTIGFIGLVGPHVARIFVGSNNRYLIPASAAFGAAFILLADSLAKVTGVSGLPVGVISSMVGGPLFIWILIRQRRSAWA